MNHDPQLQPLTLSIVIPVYNEERTLAALIEKVQCVDLPRSIKKEIIIVDDGSTDSTSQILNDWKDYPNVKLFSLESNQGKTEAVRKGIAQSTGDLIIMQDADLEYDPSQYPLLLNAMLDNDYDIVYGSRFLGTIENMKFDNRMANKISNWTINLLYASHMTDFHSCFKLFRRSALKGISICSDRFSFDTELTCKFLKKGFTIHEVPIRYKARSKAEGKKITWGTALKSYGVLIRSRFSS